MKEIKNTSIDIQHYLTGLIFPASKEDIMDCALKNNAPAQLIKSLDKLEDQEFISAVEVQLQLGKKSTF